jgi:O-antigen/teichoic acid export membrane protein
MAFSGKWVFSVIFGAEWEASGTMAGFIAASAMAIVSSPLSSIYRILSKQRLEFYLNILFVMLKALALLPGIYYENIGLSVISYCLVSFMCSAISILTIFQLLSIPRQRVLLHIIIGFMIFVLLYYVYI